MIEQKNVLFLLIGLVLIIIGYPYYLFLHISGMYYSDISAAFVPLITPVFVIVLFLVSAVFFYILKRLNRFPDLFSNPSSLFLYTYTALLLFGLIDGIHLSGDLSFFINYLCAAVAFFVTGCFLSKNTKKHHHDPESLLNVVPRSFSQFLIIAIIFSLIGVLLAAYWQWYGDELGKVRPIFAHGSTRTIWTQLPIYLFCLGTFVWWPIFSVFHRTFQSTRYFTISVGATFISILLIYGHRRIINLLGTLFWNQKLWPINLAFFGACFLTAFLFWLLFFKTNKAKFSC